MTPHGARSGGPILPQPLLIGGRYRSTDLFCPSIGFPDDRRLREVEPGQARSVSRISSCDQPFRGNLYSVAAHRDRDGTGARSHFRPQRPRESASQ